MNNTTMAGLVAASPVLPSGSAHRSLRQRRRACRVEIERAKTAFERKHGPVGQAPVAARQVLLSKINKIIDYYAN